MLLLPTETPLFRQNDANDITMNLDSNSTLILSGLQSSTGTPICIDTSNNVVACPGTSVSLQNAYNGGNTLTTTDARNISFTLADTATDSNFTITTADDSTGYTSFSRVDGTGTNDPSQLILIDNLDANRAIAAGIKVQAAAGGITNALDLSDAEIVNALSLGANDITATQWSIAGSTGLITTAGDLAINGGDLTTTQTTFNLLNATATTLNFAGAAATLSIGATTGTASINNETLSLPNATVVSAPNAAATFDSVSVGGGYGSTGIALSNTGNIQANGTLTIDGASLLSGNVTATLDLAVNGGDLTSSAGTFNLLNTGVTTLNLGGAATTIGIGAGTGRTTLSNNLTANLIDNNADALDIQQGSDNYININTTNTSENISFGNATTNPSYSFLGSGTTTFTGGATVNGAFDANNASTFTPNDANDVLFTTDSDSTLRITGLADTTGTPLCLNSSNDLVTCSGQSITLQSAYNGGNTLTTTDARNIAFTLANTATDSNFTIQSAAGSTGYTYLSLANGTNTTSPSQLLLLENLDTDEALASAIKIQSEAGLITNGIDLSDPEIGNALSLG